MKSVFKTLLLSGLFASGAFSVTYSVSCQPSGAKSFELYVPIFHQLRDKDEFDRFVRDNEELFNSIKHSFCYRLGEEIRKQSLKNNLNSLTNFSKALSSMIQELEDSPEEKALDRIQAAMMDASIYQDNATYAARSALVWVLETYSQMKNIR